MEVLQIINIGTTQISLGTGETIDAGNTITVCIDAPNTITGGTCNIAHLLVPSPYTMSEAQEASPYLNVDGGLDGNGNPIVNTVPNVTAVDGTIGGVDVIIGGVALAIGKIAESVVANNTTISVAQ